MKARSNSDHFGFTHLFRKTLTMLAAFVRSVTFTRQTWSDVNAYDRAPYSTLKRTSGQLVLRSKRILKWALESPGTQFDVNRLLMDALLLEGTCDGHQVQVRQSIRYLVFIYFALHVFQVIKSFLLIRYPDLLLYLIDVYLTDDTMFQMGGSVVMAITYLSIAIYSWQMHRINLAYETPFDQSEIAIQCEPSPLSITPISNPTVHRKFHRLRARHALGWIRPLLSSFHRRNLGLSAAGERRFGLILEKTHRWIRPGTTWSILTGYSCLYYTLGLAFVRLPLQTALFISMPFTLLMQLSLGHFWAAVWATYAVFLNTCYLLCIGLTDCARRFQANRIPAVRAAIRPLPQLLDLFSSADAFFGHTVCVVQLSMMVANLIFMFMIVLMPAPLLVRLVFMLTGASVNLALILPIFVLNTLVYKSVILFNSVREAIVNLSSGRFFN